MMNKTCKNCGNSFEAKNKRALFCSASCRVSYWKQQKRQKEKKPFYKVKKQLLDKWVLIVLIIFLGLTVIYIYLPDIMRNMQNEQLNNVREKYKLEKSINERLLNTIEEAQKRDKEINIEEVRKDIEKERNEQLKD